MTFKPPMTQNPIAQTSNVDATRGSAPWRRWLAAATKPGIGAVIALTIAGGVLRLLALHRPPLLYDEAATYTRVCGSFAQMLDTLRDDGFPPLHYALYWLLGKVVTLTPAAMRIIPTLAGTMMIPAIYFLARQMTSRRVATVAAAMTAFSAYMLVYSRDAKMYMELWLLGTLFIACLLWWMRTGKPGAWLAWVAAACAMNATQALGLFLIAVALVIVLTHPLLTRRLLLLAIVGMLIASAGLGAYELLFNRWGQTIQESGWHTSGLEWIALRNRQLSKSFLMWDTAASWLVAYRAPRPPITPPTRVIVPVAIVSTLLIALLFAGAFPWPRKLRDDDPDEAPFGQRRAVLSMAVWVLLPAIAFYILSFGFGKDIWNARYLAIIWPAVAVLMALAFQRLPHPGLRAGAIALFIGANLLQFGLRLTVENGAPLDAVAADVAAAMHSPGGTLRTVIVVNPDPDNPGLGGNGGVFGFPGTYYLAIATGRRFTPQQLRNGSNLTMFDLHTDYHSPPASTTKLIVWQDGPVMKTEDDPVLQALGPGWSRLSSMQHAVRDFWCWRSMFRCHRSVYARRAASAATKLPPRKKKRRG